MPVWLLGSPSIDRPKRVDFKDILHKRVARDLHEKRWATIQLVLTPKDDLYFIPCFTGGICSLIIAQNYRKLDAFGSIAAHDFNVLLPVPGKEFDTGLGVDVQKTACAYDPLQHKHFRGVCHAMLKHETRRIRYHKCISGIDEVYVIDFSWCWWFLMDNDDK